MAFISTTVTAFSGVSLSTNRKLCSLNGAPVSRVTARRSAALAPRRGAATTTTMVEYPSSAVLGVGKEIPSFLFLMASVFAFPLGCYAIYMSNIFHPLTAEGVNAQFVVGSLLVPISWGLHVAGFIQMKNNK